ncbi:hypothetical protein T8K17_18175 [Thalassobaculum sp. OXR-137]|uniref:hypothetical protein n=1 Tax=Thalassobaculum sp. OXR-137 TaxID=3100173 RepID=UPI002AC8A2C2|nr:hypothetical protein [Thalassobaculum sp. OXR-137]WPZ33158.1 hypothetical protein T8K17_18175 [Thalassobaculum sp. OXR-137]
MLTIKDFIRETLQQISDAALEFDAEKDAKGATVFPVTRRQDESAWEKQNLMFLGVDEAGAIYASFIDFDLAVTVQEAETASGSGGISILSVAKAGGQVQTQASNSSVSRIRFKLPLQLRRR